METSLKTGFAQVFSCCPKNLSCPNFRGAAAPLAPPARAPMGLITVSCFNKLHVHEDDHMNLFSSLLNVPPNSLHCYFRVSG